LLRDRLKQQEGDIRVRSSWTTRDLLGDPKTGFGALVFFNCASCGRLHQQLSTFDRSDRQQEARELQAQGGKRDSEETRLRMSIGARRGGRRSRLAARASGAAQARSALDRFWHYFKRAAGQKSLELLRQSSVVAMRGRNLHAERSASTAKPH